MKKALIMLMMALSFAIGAQAQTQTIPDDAFGKEVKAIIDITMGENNYADIYYDLMKTQLSGMMSDEKLRLMCNELTEALLPAIYYATYTAYKEIFTLKDLKDIHTFYKTPTGQKLAKNLAKISSVVTEVMQSPDTQQLMFPIIMKYIQ